MQPPVAAQRSSLTAAVEDNPFVIPRAEEAFRARQRAASERAERRRAASSMRIEEKTSYTSTLGATRRAIAALAPDVDPVALRRARAAQGLIHAATAVLAKERKRDPESTSDFIAKKRELLLLQLSVTAKAEEITRLERDAAAAEAAVAREEEALEDDSARFEAFLKNNDTEVRGAGGRPAERSRPCV
jgi:hypothetical protein